MNRKNLIKKIAKKGKISEAQAELLLAPLNLELPKPVVKPKAKRKK